jgi:hypothetical protein
MTADERDRAAHLQREQQRCRCWTTPCGEVISRCVPCNRARIIAAWRATHPDATASDGVAVELAAIEAWRPR